MDSPPPAYDTTSSMPSSGASEVNALMTAAAPPPEYSTCLDPSNLEVVQVEHIPSGSRASHCVIPDPLDCNESSSFSAHHSITIVSGSFNISTRATHPLSSSEPVTGCVESEFRSSVSDTPPPTYEAAIMMLRLHPVEIMSHDDTSCPDHVMSTVPPTQRAAPFINDLLMSNNHPPIPHSTSVAQPGGINLEDTTATQRQMGEPPDHSHCLSFISYVYVAAFNIGIIVSLVIFVYGLSSFRNSSVTYFLFFTFVISLFFMYSAKSCLKIYGKLNNDTQDYYPNNSNISTSSDARVPKTYANIAKSVISKVSAAASSDNVSSNPADMKQSIVKLIHKGIREKNKKANNIVIHGFIQAPDEDSDTLVESVKEFCFANLDINVPEIRFCRRLGKPIENKIQPLLVSFFDSRSVDAILSNARSMLRRSDDPYIRNNIFFSAVLTEEESIKAFEKRREKRKQAEQELDDFSKCSSSDNNCVNSVSEGYMYKTATAGPSYTKGGNVWYVMGISKKA